MVRRDHGRPRGGHVLQPAHRDPPVPFEQDAKTGNPACAEVGIEAERVAGGCTRRVRGRESACCDADAQRRERVRDALDRGTGRLGRDMLEVEHQIAAR
jgi:hypothetical protein